MTKNFLLFVLYLKAVFTVLTSHLARGRCVDAVQGALVQEVARRRPVLKRSAWTPSMTVHPHFKRCAVVENMWSIFDRPPRQQLVDTPPAPNK